jgi:adenylate cyclase, class 2
VAVETEIKLRIMDRESLRERLLQAGAHLKEARHFEDNFVLDFADGRLGQNRALLRVRSAGHECRVTFKGAPRPAGPFKQREETEFTAGDKEACLQVFRQIGLEVWFRYQKFREEFEMSCCTGTVQIAVDDTPIGGFAEIEGAEDAIREVAGMLGFAESDFVKESYYTLYDEECRKAGVEPADMVFPNAIM